ncbi:MAG: hypothetical protein JXB17_13235 [Bacteroidales bacterium]|nr:hypothetical protein [Bacteroidales bacterium]
MYLAYVMVQFNFIKKEPLLKELIDWIILKQDENSRFKTTSVFQIYKKWDFGNKKEDSPWLTYLCLEILRKYNRKFKPKPNES